MLDKKKATQLGAGRRTGSGRLSPKNQDVHGRQL